jgi:hypothetical protein
MDASQPNPKIEPFWEVTEEEKTDAGTIAVTCGTKQTAMDVSFWPKAIQMRSIYNS